MGYFKTLHLFSTDLTVFCLYVTHYCCGLPKRAESGKPKESVSFYRFFLFFHKFFPLCGCVPLTCNKKENTKPSKNADRNGIPCFFHIFLNRFSTPRQQSKAAKNKYISHISCLSTVSAGTTNITIYYLYHSFVIYRVARNLCERVSRKEFL